MLAAVEENLLSSRFADAGKPTQRLLGLGGRPLQDLVEVPVEFADRDLSRGPELRRGVFRHDSMRRHRDQFIAVRLEKLIGSGAHSLAKLIQSLGASVVIG